MLTNDSSLFETILVSINDKFVELFLNNKIKFTDISKKMNKMLNLNSLKLENISKIYVNRGPGSFAGIRNSLSVVKAINLALKIDYYCYSFEDFTKESNFKYENIPNLCNKFKVKKNMINPIYNY